MMRNATSAAIVLLLVNSSGCVFADLESSPNFTELDGGFVGANVANASTDGGADMFVERDFDVVASEIFGSGNIVGARTGFDAIVDGFGVAEMTTGGSVVSHALNYDGSTTRTFSNALYDGLPEGPIVDASTIFDAVFLDESFFMTTGATASEVVGQWCRNVSQACASNTTSAFDRGTDLVLIKPDERDAETVQFVTNEDGSGVILGTISTRPVFAVQSRDTMGFAQRTSSFSAVRTESGAIQMAWFSAESGNYFHGRWSSGRFAGSPERCPPPGLSDPVIVPIADGETHAMLRDGAIVIGCEEGVELELNDELVTHFDIIDRPDGGYFLAWTTDANSVWAAVVEEGSNRVSSLTLLDDAFGPREVRVAISEDGERFGVVGAANRFKGYVLRFE